MPKAIETNDISEKFSPPASDDTSGLAQAAYRTREGCEYISILANRVDDNVERLFGNIAFSDTAIANKSVADKAIEVQNLYDRAVEDPQRRQSFRDRMEQVKDFDAKTYTDILEVGEKIGKVPAIAPAELGKELAKILQETLKRHRVDGAASDIGSEGVLATMGAMSGLFMAERGSAAPGGTNEASRAMVDAAEAQLRSRSGSDGFIFGGKGEQIPVNVHGILWADDGEPAFSAYSDDYKGDRLRFSLGN